MPKPFLQLLPAYKEARSLPILKREEQVLAHPIVQSDYGLKRGAGGTEKIVEDLGIRGVQPSSLNTSVFQVYRSAYSYLSDPDERERLKKMAEEKSFGYLIGVRCLMEEGVDDWLQLKEKFGPPPEDVEVKEPEAEPVKEAPAEPKARGKIRELFHQALDEWEQTVSEVEQLKERVKKLEQSNKSLKGENRVLEQLLAEMEQDMEDAQENVKETPALPQEIQFNGGRPRPFDYSSRFTKAFAGLQRYEQKQAVKCLTRLPSVESKKLSAQMINHYHLPENTLASRVGRQYRILWKPTPDGKVRVYHVVSKQDYVGSGMH